MSDIRIPQNPGIGGLNELTTSEETFIQNLAGLAYQAGDILYHNGTSLTRLAIGSTDEVLTVVGGLPSWEPVASGGVAWGDITGTVTDQTDLVTYVTGLPVSTFDNDAGYVTASNDYGTQGSVLFLGSSGQITEDNSNLFWDDSNNRLGIGTNSPSQKLTLSGTNESIHIANASNENSYFGTFPTLFQFSYNRVPATGVIPNSSQSAAYVNVKGGTGASTIGFSVATAVNTQPIEVMNIANSIIVLNELGNDMDFRVESDGDASNLFSDGGTNRVGIGTAIPTAKLHVNNTVAADIGLKVIDPTSSSNYSFAVQNPAGTQSWLAHNTFGGIASVLQIASSGSKYFQMESYASDNNYFSAGGATFAIRTIGAHNMAFFTDTSTQRMLISGASGHLVVGSTSTNGDARVHSINSAGSNHLRIGVDISNTVYANWSLGSTGNLTMDIGGGSASDPLWIFSDDVRITTAGTNSASAVTVGGTQTLTNKTLTAPTLDGAVNIDGTPNTDDTFNGPSTNSFNAGATIAQWEAVYLDTSSTWQLTDADAASTAGSVMVALATAAGSSGNALRVALPGSFCRNDTWNWTVGGPVYLDTTAGALTQTPPSGTDDVIRVVGFAVNADTVFWNPSPDYITHT